MWGPPPGPCTSHGAARSRRRVSWSERQGPGLGCRLGFPLRAPPEEPGRTWGVSWALGGSAWPSEHLRGKALGQVCPALSASGAGTR